MITSEKHIVLPNTQTTFVILVEMGERVLASQKPQAVNLMAPKHLQKVPRVGMWSEEAGTGEGDAPRTPSAHLSFHGQTTGYTGSGRVTNLVTLASLNLSFLR